MTKEELVDLIKETVTALNAAPAAPAEQAEVINSEPEKPVEEEKPVEPCPECENTCDEKKDEVKNEEPPAEEKKDEPAEPEVKPEPEAEVKPEPEVIKVEALNSMPVASQYDVAAAQPAWKNMHGQEFFNWLQKHPKGI